MNPLQDSFSFLIETLFELFMLLVLLRFWFQTIQVNLRNPIVGPIVNLTQTPLAWLRRFVPGIFGVDLSAILLLIAVAFVKLVLLSTLMNVSFNFASGLTWAIAKFLDMSIWMFIIALIIQAILSWFMPQPNHPMVALLADLTRPILLPIRSLLPSMGGLDFTPIIAIVALNFIQKLFIGPLYFMAHQFL